MPRVKGGVNTKRRHKKMIKLAEGYYGRKKNSWKSASGQVEKGWTYAYTGRKLKKRDFRKLWITRLNAACRQNGISYSRFISGLKKADVALDRKQLAEIAVADSAAFSKLVEIAKEKVLASRN